MYCRIILCLLVFFSVNSSVHAKEQNGNGFYGLLGLGRGYNHFSASNFSADQHYSNSHWNLAGRVALGFNIDNHIGVELGGRYGKERKFNNINSTGIDGKIEQLAYTAQTVIRWPFMNSFNLLGKFGSAYIETDKTISSGAQPSVQAGSIHAWQPMYSLGISMDLDSLPGLSLLAEYSSIIGDHDKNLPNADLYIIGFIFQGM